MSEPRAIKLTPGDAQVVGIASVRSLLGSPQGAPFTVGVVEFQSGEAENHVEHDEALYCLSGAITIEQGDVAHELTEGDLLWLPAGVTIRFVSTAPGKLLYMIHPVQG